MKFEKIDEDLTTTIGVDEESLLVQKIPKKYDDLEDSRMSQLDDIKLVRDTVYKNQVPQINGWDSKIELPDIYELAQTLKSHMSNNLYSHPDAMFDVSGTSPLTLAFANRQKAILVYTFELMKIESELE